MRCIMMSIEVMPVAVVVAVAVRPAGRFPVAVFTIVSSAMSGNNVPVKIGCIVRVPINQVLIMWIKMLDRGSC